MSERLICPSSGQPCRHDRYCRGLKEAHEGSDAGLAYVLIQDLPMRIRDALQGNYCADKRIEALCEVTDSLPASSPVGQLANLLAFQILEAKNMFPSSEQEG